MNIINSQKITSLQLAEKTHPNSQTIIRGIIFNHISWNLFDQIPSVSRSKAIIVSGHILGDGKGDYAHMLNLVKELRKKFPNKKIILVTSSDKKHEGKLSASKTTNCEQYIDYRPANDFLGESLFGEELKVITQKIQESDLWISGPVNISGAFFNSLNREAEEKGIAIQEYDTQTNYMGRSFKKEIQMGLSPSAYGILIKPLRQDYSWDSLENKQLKEMISKTHELFFCYVSSPIEALLFIKNALAFAKHSSPGKGIDIFYPCKETSQLVFLKDYFSNKECFNKTAQKVKNIVFVHFVDGEKIENEIFLSEEGIQLRIINPGLLTKKDFKIFTLLTSPLVGCTGNTSLSQTLSYGKVPFYETLGHTIPLSKNLTHLAQKKFGENSPLAQFLCANFDSHNNQTKSYERLNELISQAKEFGTLLKENYAFNSLFRGMVNEELYRRADPEFAVKEDAIKQEYMDGEISIEKAQERLNDLVASNHSFQ